MSSGFHFNSVMVLGLSMLVPVFLFVFYYYFEVQCISCEFIVELKSLPFSRFLVFLMFFPGILFVPLNILGLVMSCPAPVLSPVSAFGFYAQRRGFRFSYFEKANARTHLVCC